MGAIVPADTMLVSPESYASDSEQPSLAGRLEAQFPRSMAGGPTLYRYLVRKGEVPSLHSDTTVVRIVFEERVFFDTNSYELRGDADDIIKSVARAIASEPTETAVFVAGHTDIRGADDYNMGLSVRRATMVARRLRLMSPNVRIYSIGFGKSVPLRPNDGPENMAINRRVEFVLSGEQDAAVFWLTKQSRFLCATEAVANPEVCSHPDTSGMKFRAVPIERKPIRVAAPGPNQITPTKNVIPSVQLSAPPPIEITLSPPPVIEVGPPSR